MGEKTEPHSLDGRLEPEAREVIRSAADAALVSIAVSLMPMCFRWTPRTWASSTRFSTSQIGSFANDPH